jgi:hypothetical protein
VLKPVAFHYITVQWCTDIFYTQPVISPCVGHHAWVISIHHHCQVCVNIDCSIYQSLLLTAGWLVWRGEKVISIESLFTWGMFCIWSAESSSEKIDTTRIQVCAVILTKWELGCLSLGLLSQPTLRHLHHVHCESQTKLSLCSLPKIFSIQYLIFISEKLHPYEKDKFICWWQKYHYYTCRVRQLLIADFPPSL